MQTRQIVVSNSYKFKGFETEAVIENIQLQLAKALDQYDDAADRNSGFTAKIVIERTNFQKDDDDADRIDNPNQMTIFEEEGVEA